MCYSDIHWDNTTFTNSSRCCGQCRVIRHWGQINIRYDLITIRCTIRLYGCSNIKWQWSIEVVGVSVGIRCWNDHNTGNGIRQISVRIGRISRESFGPYRNRITTLYNHSTRPHPCEGCGIGWIHTNGQSDLIWTGYGCHRRIYITTHHIR